jgi:hypothetical protein
MESVMWETLATGGPFAVLTVIVIWMYVRDRKNSEQCIREDRTSSEKSLREDRIFMEDRLTKILDADQKSREEHTKALTELTTVLVRMNGKEHRS